MVAVCLITSLRHGVVGWWPWPALGVTLPPVRIDSQCKYGLLSRGQGDIYMRLPKYAP